MIEIHCDDCQEKYTDSDFNPDVEGKMLGERIMSEPAKRYIKSWGRASEIEGAVLFRDGASYEDVT